MSVKKKQAAKIRKIGRLQYYVPSNTRGGLDHMVDLEPDLTDEGKPDPKGEQYRCACEAFTLLVHRPCRHIRRVVKENLESLGFEYDDLIDADSMLTHGMHPVEVIRFFLGKVIRKPVEQPQEKPTTKRQYHLRTSTKSKIQP